MVRSGCDRVPSVVEVDETYWGGEDPGAMGRGAGKSSDYMIIVAAQEDGRGIGRIRLRRIPT